MILDQNDHHIVWQLLGFGNLRASLRYIETSAASDSCRRLCFVLELDLVGAGWKQAKEVRFTFTRVHETIVLASEHLLSHVFAQNF